MRMSAVVFGSNRFGSECLEIALRNCEVELVVSPEWYKPGVQDLTFLMAQEWGLPWVDAADFHPERVTLGCHLGIAAHYTRYIGKRTRASFVHGVLGLHPSLLPRHRGPDAVRWTAYMGDYITGFTAYWMDDGYDTGPIQDQEQLWTDPDWTPVELWDHLRPVGRKVLAKALGNIHRMGPTRLPQPELGVTREPAFDSVAPRLSG